MGVKDRIETETLRRLHGAQRLARRGGDDKAGFVDLLDRVAEPRSGRGGAVARSGGDGARDQRFGREGARAVMDQHEIGRLSRLRLEAGQNAGLARRAAQRRRPQATPRIREKAPRRPCHSARDRRDG